MASDAELKWIAQVIETGDYKKATRDCFPDVSPASIPSKTSQLKKKHLDEIDEGVRASYKEESATMRNMLKSLALNASQEAVKLKAITDWLSRAGHNAVQETRELTEKPSEAELQARLKLALSGLDKDTIASLMDGDTLKTIAKQATQEKPNDATEH